MAYELEYLITCNLGSIHIFNDGEVEPLDNSLKNPLLKLIKKHFIETENFKNPLIPGVLRRVKILDSKQILQIIKSIQQEIRIWIAHPENPVTLAPWFGTKGLAILRHNDSNISPCFVIQDMATHAQAFYRSRTDHDEIYWHYRPIVDTELVKGWTDWDVYIIESLDDIDLAF